MKFFTACSQTIHQSHFSERELTHVHVRQNVNSHSRSLYAIARPSVVCLSVTLVHPTQAVAIFGNIGSRPSDHYFRSLSVCLFVQSSSQPSSIRFGSNQDTCYMSGSSCVPCATPGGLGDPKNFYFQGFWGGREPPQRSRQFLWDLVSWPSADIHQTFQGDRPRGTPPSELNTRWVARYSDFWNYRSRPWARYGPRAPSQLYQTRFLKHRVPLNMKSSGNSKNIGPHYPFGSNVGPHHQNAKFSNVLLRRRISEFRSQSKFSYLHQPRFIVYFCVFGATVCKTVCSMLSDRCLSVCPVCLSCLSVCLQRSCTVAKRLEL